MNTELAESTLLEAGFDPSTLGPGLYTASSDTEAYAMLRAMIAAGDAEFVGERYLPDSRLVVSASVGGGESGMEPGYAQNPAGMITIGREFFATALKDYSNWQEMWWRESIQNSVDAGARGIEISAIENDDGPWTITCRDDGGGMTEDVLLNKFLVLGATTKIGAAGIAGGFGKAKEMLLLPWLSWEIHSRDRIVKGSGIDYEIESADFFPGTRITVRMPAAQHTERMYAVNFVKKCYLPRVTFHARMSDGSIDPFYGELKPGKLIREMPGEAKFYINKSDEFSGMSYMFIRANGLYMFSKFLGLHKDVGGNVIAELDGPSIKLLTANRNGFVDKELDDKIDAFASEIATDARAATRAKSTTSRHKYKGTGKHLAVAQAEAGLIEAAGVLRQQGTGTGDYSLEPENIAQMKILINQLSMAPVTVKSGLDMSGQSAGTVEVIMDGMQFKGPEHLSAVLKQMAWEPDFYLINEIEGFRIPSKFKPERMPPSILRLAKTWTELCRFVLIQLGARAAFGVGFHFDEETRASYIEDGDEHWLLFNPLTYPEKRVMTPSNDEDLKEMYASAIHECTHMADGIGKHNDIFAAALTKNMAICADGFRKIRRIVRAIHWRRAGAPADASDEGLSENPDEFGEYEEEYEEYPE
jgi:hypothetical protein